jgi:hypothetical protein
MRDRVSFILPPSFVSHTPALTVGLPPYGSVTNCARKFLAEGVSVL